MKIEQIYTGCLAHGAYYIESNGEAAVIDPLRDIQPYIDLAHKRNARIKYIFETHFHADFVSGHVDLSKKAGAPIIYGPAEMKTGFEMVSAKDGTVFKLGDASVRLIHTPGHTLESSCYLLSDEKGKETALFTGDTLFIGDVGRPDLAQHVIADLTQEKLAGLMYDSIQNRIKPLPDELVIYPGHGAGSACGKNLSSEKSDTLGNQKKTNYALRDGLSKEEFIKELLTGLTQPPSYFRENVLMNIKGYDQLENILQRGKTKLSVEEFNKYLRQEEVFVLDSRSADEFEKGFIPGTVNIGIDGNFAVWAGTIIKDIRHPIVFIASRDREEEVIIRLARVGFDNITGFLEGGVESWIASGREIETVKSISADEFSIIYNINPSAKILDVRKKSEYDSQHLIGAVNEPLDYFNKTRSIADKNDPWYVYCGSGYRSMTFISLRRKEGFHNLINIKGGFNAISSSGKFDLTNYVCPITML